MNLQGAVMKSRTILMIMTNVIFLLLSSCGVLEGNHSKSVQASRLQSASSIGGYSCEQQASWGKCSESWMHPTCDYACPVLSPSIGGYSCEQQASWGKCGESWMHPTCDYACPATGNRGYANGGLMYPDLGAHNGPRYGGGYGGGGGYTNGGLMYPDLGAHNGGGCGRGYTNGGLIYPDLGGHNGPYNGGGYGCGGYTNGGLIYPDLGAHNGPGY